MEKETPLHPYSSFENQNRFAGGKKIRMLVFSNDPFGKSNSVGRTLASVLCDCTDYYDVAMFFTRNSVPDYPIESYYRITDKEALKGFFNPKNVGSRLQWKPDSAKTQNSVPPVKKTAFKMLIRDFLWRRIFKKDRAFLKWINDFDPDILVLNGYDTAFLFREAALISKKRNIPLVIYTAEDYPFKRWDPYKRNGHSNLVYWFWRQVLRKAYLTAYKQSSLNLYTDKAMEEVYRMDFPTQNSLVTMTSAQVTSVFYSPKESKPISVLYAGSLPGRWQSLIAVSGALYQADKNAKIIIFCVSPSSPEALELGKQPNVSVRGFLEIDKLNEVIKTQDLILNIEDFAPYWVRDRQRIFSTKIANSLACGIPFLDFSPESCFTTRYLEENNAAFVVTEEKGLLPFFRRFCGDLAFRKQHLESASRCVALNHDGKKTQISVFQRIQAVLNKKDSSFQG